MADLDALRTELARANARITQLQRHLSEARQEAACFRDAWRVKSGLPTDPAHAICRIADDVRLEIERRRLIGTDEVARKAAEKAATRPPETRTPIRATSGLPEAPQIDHAPARAITPTDHT